jgi:hypothetical protein
MLVLANRCTWVSYRWRPDADTCRNIIWYVWFLVIVCACVGFCRYVYVQVYLTFCEKKWIFYHGAAAPSVPRPPRYQGFTGTLRHTTFSRTPLDEWSGRRKELYLTTNNTHKSQTTIPPAGFELTIPASERLQTHPLDRVATGIGEKRWLLSTT